MHSWILTYSKQRGMISVTDGPLKERMGNQLERVALSCLLPFIKKKINQKIERNVVPECRYFW